ncbi:lipopolysaccharide biosynthesis protein [Fluviicola chungangensis]|uniref:Oligosaccharide flippase family protein n=1 Tax=Fluviicola chungangensis TaxID=2597671 RepID=A0A556MPZ6_9FLAO|nr:polysaccharide biosynthesis C-terminal domain-containing protein [Fluviicola chungangensis]TSJ41986.1 oligosaccharide flippase family protein [Fluviicola chungangensis]
MGLVQKDALRTMIISYIGIVLGYLNKGFLFIIILSTAQIGLVNLIYSVGVLFAQFANMGTIYTTWRFFPVFRNESRKHHGFLPLMILFVLVGIVLCTLATFFFRDEIEQLYLEKSPDFVDYYVWFIPIGISTVFFLVFEVYLRGLYKNIISVFANEIVLRLALTMILGIYWMKWVSFSTFVILHSLIYFIPVLMLLIYMVRIGEFNIKLSSIQISKRFRRILVKSSSYFYINTLGLVIVASLDVVMLAQMDGLESTGIYSTVLFLASALQVPYKSIIRISAPLVSEHWKNRQFGEIKSLYIKISSVSLTIGLGLFLFTWLNIDFLFSFLKPEFSLGIWVFFFIMMGRIFDMYCGINSSIFTSSKKYKYDVYFTVSLILIVYFLNLLFIPVWGMNGAAISTSIALALVNLGRLIFVWNILKMHPFTWNQVTVIFAGLLTLTSGTFIQNYIQEGWILFFCESILVLALFIFPVYYLKLDTEIVNYTNKLLGVIFKRSGK